MSLWKDREHCICSIPTDDKGTTKTINPASPTQTCPSRNNRTKDANTIDDIDDNQRLHGAIWTVEAVPDGAHDGDSSAAWQPMVPDLVRRAAARSQHRVLNCVACPAGMYSNADKDNQDDPDTKGSCKFCSTGRWQQNKNRVNCDACSNRCQDCSTCDVWGNCPSQGLKTGYCLADNICYQENKLGSHTT